MDLDYEEYVDLSDGPSNEVATIQGSKRTLLGMLGMYCWIKTPGNSKRITVNAGVITVVAMCVTADAVTTESMTYAAAFHFDAIAGHVYEVEAKCDGCLRLRDITTSEVVAESSSRMQPRDPPLSKNRQATLDRAHESAEAQIEAVTPARIILAKEMLNSLGYESGELTGVVDAKTRNAVIDYQFDYNLEITGWIDDSLIKNLETRISAP